MIKVTIDILGKKYSAKGDTVNEALEKLSYDGFARLKSILTVDYGDKERTIVLYPLQTLRLFSKNKLAKEIAVKNTSLRF